MLKRDDEQRYYCLLLCVLLEMKKIFIYLKSLGIFMILKERAKRESLTFCCYLFDFFVCFLPKNVHFNIFNWIKPDFVIYKNSSKKIGQCGEVNFWLGFSSTTKKDADGGSLLEYKTELDRAIRGQQFLCFCTLNTPQSVV